MTEKLPVDIANIIFSQEPQQSKTYQLFCSENNNDGNGSSVIDIFEIFLTIMIEGINVRCGGSISKEAFMACDENTILSLQPWLNSLGYRVNVSTIPKENKPDYETFYCQIALSADPVWKLYFEMKQFLTNYQFILGDKSPFYLNQNCFLQNLYAVLIKNNVVYKISFDFI